MPHPCAFLVLKIPDRSERNCVGKPRKSVVVHSWLAKFFAEMTVCFSCSLSTKIDTQPHSVFSKANWSGCQLRNRLGFSL